MKHKQLFKILVIMILLSIDLKIKNLIFVKR